MVINNTENLNCQLLFEIDETQRFLCISEQTILACSANKCILKGLISLAKSNMNQSKAFCLLN